MRTRLAQYGRARMHVVAFCLCTLFGTWPAFAGQNEASIVGQVKDGSGAVLPGVTVVAKSRDQYRTAVADAIESGLRPSIYGSGWEPFVDQALVVREYVPNDELPNVYSSVGVLLNDHWQTMREHGLKIDVEARNGHAHMLSTGADILDVDFQRQLVLLVRIRSGNPVGNGGFGFTH